MHERLKQYAESGMKYFSIKDGETKIVKFVSYDLTEPVFRGYQRKQMAGYVFEVNGRQLRFDRENHDLAGQLAGIPLNSVIEITRRGLRNHTKYFVNILLSGAENTEPQRVTTTTATS